MNKNKIGITGGRNGRAKTHSDQPTVKQKIINMKFQIKQIGIIHSPYKTKDKCPIQGSVKPNSKGIIEVFPEYKEGLETIETFSHIILFYIFDKAGEIKLSRPTFLDDTPHGVFASRHPCRPNSIGISIVKLEKINKNILEVNEIDILDNTPLIDIKPYIPRFDYRKNANNGWIQTKKLRKKPANRE
ncbi:MAG: tRNA (N6-threonylcarbamoyladenosine(37)-N6)-methyltransferase TrmO [Desulfovibrionales bacterium]|nr:tRNA (N6-threonylcarbamoyladenosine(37)-N6)-methyltransferase TrmO [Desulfovibrionales bacterium]